MGIQRIYKKNETRTKMKQKIWPSIVAKDQKELNILFKKLKGSTKTLHLDIVDGKFADNHSLDFNFKLSKKFSYTAHLMIKNPERWIKKNLFRIEVFIPHIEEVKDVDGYIKWMKSNGKKIAFAVLPGTKVKAFKKYLGEIDYANHSFLGDYP